MAKYIPISKEHHRQAGWTPFQSYAHAQGNSLVPLMVTELARAQQCLPICFTQVNDTVLPAAILGIARNSNLFVAPNGRWVETYVPAHLRSYPFRLAGATDNQQVLCFDEDSGLMSVQGTRFFNDNGQVSTELQSIMEFLQSIENARAPTEHICKMIADAGILVPWEIKVKTTEQEAEQETALKGLLRVDEQALLALSTEKLKALASDGALPVVYAQLMSMQNINKLQTLITLHEQQNNQAHVTEVFGKPDDTLKFDF